MQRTVDCKVADTTAEGMMAVSSEIQSVVFPIAMLGSECVNERRVERLRCKMDVR